MKAITDEDIAEKWLNERYLLDMGIRKPCKDAFLAGLKAGRLTKWHSVANGDLPEEGVEVLNDNGAAVILLKGHWRYVYGGEWEDDACLNHWCEIPEFKEETDDTNI